MILSFVLFWFPGFTGIDQKYEAPDNPELTVRTAGKCVDDCVQQVVSLMQEIVSILWSDDFIE